MGKASDEIGSKAKPGLVKDGVHNNADDVAANINFHGESYKEQDNNGEMILDGMQYKEHPSTKVQLNIKTKLDKELNLIHFTACDQVLQHTHPRTGIGRIQKLLNRDIEISFVPAISIFLLVALLIVLPWREQVNQGQPHTQMTADRGALIEAGGNTYWQRDYERAVKLLENPN